MRLPAGFLSPRRLPIALLSALAALFGACAYDTRLGDIDARYQVPTLPLHFRGPQDKTILSVTASGNGQGRSAHLRTYRARADGNILHLSRDTSNQFPYREIEEDLRYERERFSAAAAVTWQQDELFSGLTAGLVPDNPRAYQLGAFGGFSVGAERITVSAGAGVFRNTMRKRVLFWANSKSSLADSVLPGRPREEDVYYPDTLSRWTVDWELRAACGIRFRVQPYWAPYALAEWGSVRFWHAPETGRDYRRLEDIALGGGMEVRVSEAIPIRAEVRAGKVLHGGDASPVFFQGGLGIAREW